MASYLLLTCRKPCSKSQSQGLFKPLKAKGDDLNAIAD